MTTLRRRWLAPALVLLLVGGIPHDALAFIGIFERLSGPGPFFPSLQFPVDRLFCAVGPERGASGELRVVSYFRPRRGSEDYSRDLIECLRDGDRVRLHLAFEYSVGRSDQDDVFPAVTFNGLKPILFYRVHKTLDVGAGVGFTRFSGTGHPDAGFSGEHFGFWRFSVPLRARVYAPWLESGSRWRGIHLALQEDFFPKEFTRTDFLAKPGPPTDNEFVPSVYLSVDLLTLIKGR